MRGIRLIATDMDGTLIGDWPDRIPPGNIAALREAADRGITLALATGRLPDDAGFFALDAGLPMHILALNGNAWLPKPLGEVRAVNLMRPEDARRIRAMIEELGLEYSLFGLHEAAFGSPPADLKSAMLVLGTFLDRPGGRTRVWADGRHIEPLIEKASKFVVVGVGQAERLTRLRERVTAEVPGAEVTSSWADTLEIIPGNANKGKALMALARRLGVPMEQVMAIGDNDNDVSMLEVAGCAVAMANATPAAKQVAHWIAPDCRAEGVATAVRGLALGDSACRSGLLPGGRLLN